MKKDPISLSQLEAIIERVKTMNPKHKDVLRFAYLVPLKPYRDDMPISGPINEIEFFFDFKERQWMFNHI